MSKNKGITLVTLVVTIVVLIILAGVSISATLGENGIITIAKQAKENIEQAQIQEQIELNELYTQINMGNSGGTSYDVIAKLLEFKKIIAEAITNNGVKTNETDEVKTMAENINKIRNERKTVEDLRIGDYVQYDTGITNVGNKGVITCRVLYDTHSKYGVQLISDENVSKVTLGGTDWETGKQSYNAAIEILNNEAEKYLNKNFAIDARCVGSIPAVKNGLFIKKDKGNETTVMLPGNYILPNGWQNNDTGCYDYDNNYLVDYCEMQLIGDEGIQNNGEIYWLACRAVYIHSDAGYYNFNIQRVDDLRKSD